MTHAEPRTPPSSIDALEERVLAYAKRTGIDAERVRRLISFTVLGGALGRTPSGATDTRFVVEGGVAMALRLGERARPTRDMDVLAVCGEKDVLRKLDDVLRAPLDGFTFVRRAETHPIRDRAIRVWIDIGYHARRWATVQADVAWPDNPTIEAERLRGIALGEFGLGGPVDVVCLALRYEAAHKIHAVTHSADSSEATDRYSDVIDLLLMRRVLGAGELRDVRLACEDVFHARAEQSWPPTVDLPPRWAEQYGAEAHAVGLEERDLESAARALRALIAKIAAA